MLPVRAVGPLAGDDTDRAPGDLPAHAGSTGVESRQSCQSVGLGRAVEPVGAHAQRVEPRVGDPLARDQLEDPPQPDRVVVPPGQLGAVVQHERDAGCRRRSRSRPAATASAPRRPGAGSGSGGRGRRGRRSPSRVRSRRPRPAVRRSGRASTWTCSGPSPGSAAHDSGCPEGEWRGAPGGTCPHGPGRRDRRPGPSGAGVAARADAGRRRGPRRPGPAAVPVARAAGDLAGRRTTSSTRSPGRWASCSRRPGCATRRPCAGPR